MKSLQRRFKNLELKNPSWSTSVLFSEAIRGQGFNRQAIHRWFKILVDKEDYDLVNKKQILRNLESNTKELEDNQK